jgi:hypothetical protein
VSTIIVPSVYSADVSSVDEYLKAVSNWHDKEHINETQFLSEVWFRGNGKPYKDPLRPAVYRDAFVSTAKHFHSGSVEDNVLHLERRMLDEFRTSGAVFFDAYDFQTYLIAQHHGLPTRLLDWTTNALAALFFAVENTSEHNDTGEVFIMKAKDLLPTPPPGAKGNEYLWGPVSIRHPYAHDAIGLSFWLPAQYRQPLIILVRPDNQSGRIGQQSSCFTLHMHGATDTENKSLVKFQILADKKSRILKELHRLNINQFTIYNDLDHLSKDIKLAWGLPYD